MSTGTTSTSRAGPPELRRLRSPLAWERSACSPRFMAWEGLGKTALAVEYAHAFAHDYSGGRWQVRCEGRDDLRAVVVSLAGARDLSVH